MLKPGDKVETITPVGIMDVGREGEVVWNDETRAVPLCVQFGPYRYYCLYNEVKLKEKEMKYETGRWHNWNGDAECPLPEGTQAWIACYDSSKSGFHLRNPFDSYDKEYCGGINTFRWDTAGVYGSKSQSGLWVHREGHTNVIAFFVESYPEEAKELTVSQISEILGYKVKVVK